MATLVEAASENTSFRTLVEAVKAADLVETLSAEGPFTVFAPTNEAFEKLPEGTLEALLEDAPKLRDILTFHVVVGRIRAEDVARKASLRTVQGQDLAVDARKGVRVQGARVIQSDIEAENGIIHVIDRVLLPE